MLRLVLQDELDRASAEIADAVKDHNVPQLQPKLVDECPVSLKHRSAKIEVCVCMFNHNREGEVMKNVTTVGIDLANNVFLLHGVDERGALRCP